MYLFYYDESGHSRKLSRNTIFADSFNDYFVTCIIGFDERKRKEIESDYLAFEEKYKIFYQVEELKSTILGKRKFKYGLNTFKPKDLDFLADYLDILIKHNVRIYFSAHNKIEYLISQMFRDYKNNMFEDADALRYTITKLISLYRPKNVMESIYKEKSFAKELELFLKSLLEFNKGKKHKELENIAIKEALLVFNGNEMIRTLDWNYKPSFIGFKEYLIEQRITPRCIIIDKEGEGKTKSAAFNCGFKMSIEADSKETPGIRMSDILCGIINGFLISFVETMRYKTMNEASEKHLLNPKWFSINEMQYKCYKKLKGVIIDQNSCWYKSFCSNYSDAISCFVCLLDFICNNREECLRKSNDMLPEHFNSYVCDVLQKRYDLMRNKLPIVPAEISENYFLNSRGAKEYFDQSKRTAMELREGQEKSFYVLSVGIMFSIGVPTMTVQTNDGPISIDLPIEYYQWAFDLIALANMGEKVLPATIVFSKHKDRYYADIV